MQQKKDTSWGAEASWYDTVVEEEGSYQKELILPNVLRLARLKKGERVLDVGCGQGFFSRAFAAEGADVVALDIGRELIEIALKKSPAGIQYVVSGADNLSFLTDGLMDKALAVLSLQNMDTAAKAIEEIGRVLKPGGEFLIVLNHPAFRIPKRSSWQYDEEEKILARRVDEYISESHARIDMHPGAGNRSETASFHRPLQWYFKALEKAGFCVTRLEEWVSHKHSLPGLRQAAENKARREFPLFLYIGARKN